MPSLGPDDAAVFSEDDLVGRWEDVAGGEVVVGHIDVPFLPHRPGSPLDDEPVVGAVPAENPHLMPGLAHRIIHPVRGSRGDVGFVDPLGPLQPEPRGGCSGDQHDHPPKHQAYPAALDVPGTEIRFRKNWRGERPEADPGKRTDAKAHRAQDQQGPLQFSIPFPCPDQEQNKDQGSGKDAGHFPGVPAGGLTGIGGLGTGAAESRFGAP